MNHVNFRSLQVTTSSSNFGTLTGAGPARNLQGELKIQFLCSPAFTSPNRSSPGDPGYLYSRENQTYSRENQTYFT